MTEFALERVTYRLRQPVTTAYGTLHGREVLVVRIRDEDGTEGLGEAGPLAPYRGATLDDAEAAVREFADAFDSFEGPITGTLRAIPAEAGAALDTALADREARRAGRPLAAGGPRPTAESVTVNATIAATDRAAAAREAAAAAEAGFGTVKLKVGVGDDAARVAAVRAAIGPDVALRVDANGAWNVHEAVAALRSLAPADIELCEEPVHGVADLAAVRDELDGEVAIAMDETADDEGAIESGACDFVCLKVAGCGGVTRVWAAADRARSAGSRVYVASTYDGPIGIAAGIHAAAGLGPGIPACGLATLGLFEGIDDPFPVRDGAIDVPRAPGLGVSWPVG